MPAACLYGYRLQPHGVLNLGVILDSAALKIAQCGSSLGGTRESEAGRCTDYVLGHPELHSKTLSRKIKTKQKTLYLTIVSVRDILKLTFRHMDVCTN